MTYAQQVIDTFADELFSRRHVEGGLKWRSRVLNPILQRQLQGMGHESLLSAHFIGLEGKELNEAIDEFYLHRDPLQPSQQNTLRWGVIYATDARWSLTVSTNPQMIGDECHYNQCRIHTRSLIKTLVYKGADSEELENLEVAVVVSENIDHHFSVLYPGVSLLSLIPLTFPLNDFRRSFRRPYHGGIVTSQLLWQSEKRGDPTK